MLVKTIHEGRKWSIWYSRKTLNSVPPTDTPKFQILTPSHKTPKTKTKLHYLMEQLAITVTWEQLAIRVIFYSSERFSTNKDMAKETVRLSRWGRGTV